MSRSRPRRSPVHPSFAPAPAACLAGILAGILAFLALALAPAEAPGMDLEAQAAAATGLTLARAETVQDVGHGGAEGAEGPPLPFFVNFETGANVKALVQRGNELWMGLPNGLIRYNLASYDDHTIYTVASTRAQGRDGGKPGLLANGVYALDVGPDGNLWVSTYGGGLTRFDGKAWTTYTPVEGLGDRWVYDVEFAPDGTMWVATWKGISRFDGKGFTTYTEKDGLADKWVYEVAIDPDGTIWAGTEGGVSRFDGKHFVNYSHGDGLGADIPEDERKAVMRTESRHHRTQGKANQGYNPNYVLSIATTRDGAKWFGTWGAGLSRFDGKGWTTYTAREGLGGNFVHALAVDKDGTLWAGTDGGVSYLKEGRWITIGARHGLMDDNVFSILFDTDGNAWFGTWTGLSKMTTPPPLPAGPMPAGPHGLPPGHPLPSVPPSPPAHG